MQEIIKNSQSEVKLDAKKTRVTPTIKSHFATGHQVPAPKPHFHIKTNTTRNTSDKSYMGFDNKYDKVPASAYSSRASSRLNDVSLDKIGGQRPD